jgi:glycosyltransferase involved in cell wall biosynthesis
MRKLLVLDSSYSLEAIRARKLEYSVICRDLGGFFEHVWTVHPFASLVTSEQWSAKYGRPDKHEVAGAHTFVEGKIGQFRMLCWVPSLNFLISQIYIFLYLVRLIKDEDISVIRVSSPLYLGLFGWALSRWCRKPFVLRVGGNHDKIYETTGNPIEKRLFFSRRLEKLVEKFVFPRADLVAGANQNNLDFALANGARPETSTLFRYGNLIDKRHMTEPRARPDGKALLELIDLKPYSFVLYIGRLEIVKHPDHVLRVLACVRKRGRLVKALLVGDGTQQPALKRLAKELQVENQVTFVGNKDQEWLSRIIPLAAAVISPHTGRALSECAFAGAPIVAYDVDWQGELIKTGFSGELVPYLDLGSMADSLEKLLNDSEYARKIGAEVRKRVIEMMDPEMLNQHERDQYRRVIEKFDE